MRKILGFTTLVALIIFALVLFVESSTISDTDAAADVSSDGGPSSTSFHGIPFLTSMEITDPQIAPKYGINGYLHISNSPETPSELTLGEYEQCLVFLLRFVSFSPEVTETQVTLDPSGSGLSIEQVCKTGTFKVNDLISYNVSKTITIKAGETIPVALILHKPPANFAGWVSFPAGPVGISANVPIIDDTEVTVYG